MWENRNGSAGAGNTIRTLTHSLDETKEGLAMNATRKLFPDSTLRAWETNAATIGLRAHRLPLVIQKIDSSGECWEWTASRKENGYGQYNDSDRNWNAHRLVFLLNGGEIPPAYELDHLCRNRGCVRPSHLEPVTHAENVRRQADAVTACPRGHDYSTENTYVWHGQRHCRTCRADRNALRPSRSTPAQDRNQ